MEKETDQWKYEIAEELGLLEKLKEVGWKGLSPKETGRIGGLITKKKRMLNITKSMTESQ